MAIFKPRQTVVTKAPVVAVEADLKPGTYRFQLVVENERGVQSQPAVLTVTIDKPTRGVGTPRTRRTPIP
jgi:hypothetical protein